MVNLPWHRQSGIPHDSSAVLNFFLLPGVPSRARQGFFRPKFLLRSYLCPALSLFSSSWPKRSSHCTRPQSSILKNRQLHDKHLSLDPHSPKPFQILPINHPLVHDADYENVLRNFHNRLLHIFNNLYLDDNSRTWQVSETRHLQASPILIENLL